MSLLNLLALCAFIPEKNFQESDFFIVDFN